jgi:zinc protease
MKQIFFAIVFFNVLLAHFSIYAFSSDDLNFKLSIPSEKYQLDNGLTVILSKDHTTPFVAVNIWYQIGSVNEELNKTGLAHLFEHLMFEGSKHVKAAQHFQLLENAGAFDVNASTGFERTNYFETVPKNYLELVLSLESSRMFFLKINQNKLDEQRAVVRREREQRIETAPYGIPILKLWQNIFNEKHPLHGRIIGSHKDLQAASLNDVRDFYNYYGPNNACLTLVGDFDNIAAKKLINKYFGSLPKAKPVVKKPLPQVILNQEEIIHVEENFGKLALVRMQYITPALFEPGDAELDMLSYVLTGGEHGRLTKALTRDKSLAVSTSAYQQSLEDTSVFTIDAILNPSTEANETILEIDKVLSDLITNPPSKIEMDRARNSILTNKFFTLQKLGGNAGRAELLQSYNRFAKDPNFIQQDINRYRMLDQTSLQVAATRYLPVKKARKILIATPISEKIIQEGK